MKSKKRVWKIIGYTLLFAGIAVLDWMRASQLGVYWATANNLYAVVMAAVTIPLYAYDRKKYLKIAMIWVLCCAVCGAVIGPCIVSGGEGVFASQVLTATLAVCLLGLTWVRVWTHRKEVWNRLKRHRLILAAFFVMSILMVISRYYEIWQIWYAVMFLAFYGAPISEEEHDLIWNSLINGLILGFFGLQIWAYGFRPYDVVRYMGPYGNCNMTALFYLVTYMCVLYRIHVLSVKAKTKWSQARRVLLYVLAGGLVSFMLFTMCRTALIIAVLLTGVYGVYSVIIILGKKASRLILQWGCLLLCTVLTFPCVYGTIRYLPCILSHPVWFDGEYSTEKVHSFDSWDSEKYISPDEVWEELYSRYNYGGILDKLGLKVEAAELTGTQVDYLAREDSENSVSIRKVIYRAYLERLNLWGHELREGYMSIGSGVTIYTAQNVFIQMAFCFGIPAGILFVGIIVWFLCKAVRLAASKKRTANLLPLMVWIVFVGFGLTESVWYLGQSILFLMYMTPKLFLEENN